MFEIIEGKLAGCRRAVSFRRKWRQQKPVFSKKTGFSDSLLGYGKTSLVEEDIP